MKIFDLHCDTLYKFLKKDFSFFENSAHISENGLKNGDYLVQCFAVYTPVKYKGEEAYQFFKAQYKHFLTFTGQSEVLTIAKSNFEVQSNAMKDNISAVLTVENAELLNGDLTRISELQDCGVKILGLIHNSENCIGFPHSDNNGLDNLPLKDFGREVVETVNNTNMVIDISHLNYGGFCDVASLSKKPFVATHSACRNIENHSRNLYDEQIKMIANSGGVVGVPFYAVFLNGSNKTEICDIIRHIEHLIKVGGEDVAALGTDFDGMECEMFLKTCAEMPILADALIKKFGYSVAEKICYKNALRIFK